MRAIGQLGHLPNSGRDPLVSQPIRLIELPLTPQQTSLVRAVTLAEIDHLNRSFCLDPDTGQHAVQRLGSHELSAFARSWAVAPIECIRAMNEAIARIAEPSRVSRYLEAAVGLEILMDRSIWGNVDGRVRRGIPSYLANGYTDMGSRSPFTRRRGREKIRVDKGRLRARLLHAKRQAVDSLASTERGQHSFEKLLAHYYEAVRREIAHDERSVRILYEELGDQTVDFSTYTKKGVGVCRHLSILYQLYLQEAGIPSRVAKGAVRFFGFTGRHAWNVAWFRGRVAVIDVTEPYTDEPFVLVGTSLEEAYRKAGAFHRQYLPTPDRLNHYRISGWQLTG